MEVKEEGGCLLKEGVFSSSHMDFRGFAVSSEETNAISCKLANEIGLHQKYVIIDQQLILLTATTKNVLNSPQTLFLMRRSDLGTRLL